MLNLASKFLMTLKNSFIISLFCHLLVFSLFSLSFGRKVGDIKYPYVVFWGNILPSSQILPSDHLDVGERLPLQHLPSISFSCNGPGNFYLKPHFQLASERQNLTQHIKSSYLSTLPQKKEQQLLFHPLLPGGFVIYFKDRPVVHIELKFNIIAGKKGNPVFVKRSISSGNLEVDLLSKRYIERYLYIQQAAFTPNIEQTVKIDLSAEGY
ncbi:MAG: hypothetical protein NC916_01920 [Candidatus Omnitrophica bacterium]|nr:hypothetical protein [Candidatus Omnitrophota bacterium]